MTARILSGKPIAEAIKAEVAQEVERLKASYQFRPCIVVVRVGDDPASVVYVGNKIRTSGEVGLISGNRFLPVETSQEELLATIDDLNRRMDVDGILVQLPLPPHIDESTVLNFIHPEKDVDGFHPLNAGKLLLGQPSIAPCTPTGVIEILKRSDVSIAGQNAVIVGRSNIVGKPMAILLLRENATVTICHSKTRDLSEVTSRADILIAAIGRPGYLTGDHVKSGATVVDVGINRVTDSDRLADYFEGDELEKRQQILNNRGSTLVGDANAKQVMAKAGNYTPVPGGVGLLTVAVLMRNTVEAAKLRRKIT